MRFALPHSAASICAILAFSSCSPGSLFSSGPDQSIIHQPNYQKVNTACDNLNLTSSELDAPTFRSLLHCLNSYGALDQIETLTSKLSDADLEPILKVTNKHLLNDKTALYQTISSYTTLSTSKKLAPLFTQVGKLLANDSFIAASSKILSEIYSADKISSLQAFAKLADKANLDSVSGGLDFATNMGNAPSFASLQTHFTSDVTAHTPTHEITDALSKYMRVDVADPNHVALGKELSKAFISGQLFAALDQMSGMMNDELKTHLPRLITALDAIFGNGGNIFNGVTSLFHYLNVPLSCFDGTQGLKDIDDDIFEEVNREDYTQISHFIQENKLLDFTLANPFCDLPPAFQKYYPVLELLAKTNAVEPATEFLQSLTQNGMQPLLLRIFTDTGASDNAGMKNLTPLLAETADRGALTDIALLLSSVKPGDRSAIKQTLSFLIDSQNGKSIYDTFTDNASHIDAVTLYQFVSSMSGYVDSKDPLLLPSVEMLRSTLYMNDVHPLLGIAHDILKEAPQSQDFYDSLFKVAALPEFQGSIQLLSAMAQDGRLEQITDTLATIFSHSAQLGKSPIHAQTEPVFVSSLRHALSASDLTAFNLHAYTDHYGSCSQVNFDIKVDAYSNQPAAYNQDIDAILGCMNNDGTHADAVNSVNFLRNNSVDVYNKELQGNETLFDLSIDMVKKLDFSRDEMKYVSDEFLQILGNDEIFSFLNVLPKMISQSFQGDGDASAGPVLRPLFDLAGPLSAHHEALDRLGAAGNVALQQVDFPRSVKLGDEILDELDDPSAIEALQPAPPASYTNFDRELLGRWIVSKECEYLPQDPQASASYVQARVDQLINDYENETTNFELDTTSVNAATQMHEPYLHWTKDRLREFFNPIFDKLSDPGSRYAGHSPLNALFRFINRYANDAAHPDRLKELQVWLQNRSGSIYTPADITTNNVRAISYMYPGEKWPRVKLVNTGDLFELVLINADVEVPTIGSKPPFVSYPNSALTSMAQLAVAWGDEKFADWPAEIQAMYPPGSGKTPPTLKEAVDTIFDTTKKFAAEAGISQTPGCAIDDIRIPVDPVQPIGLPEDLPKPLETILAGLIKNLPTDAKAKLFNEYQVLQVMNENLPGMVNDLGLKIFRDVFFELYISTPEQNRNATAGAKNNLNLALLLVRSGIVHEALNAIAQFKPGDTSLYDIVQTVSQATLDGNTEALADAIIPPNDSQHALAWSLIDQVFSVNSSYELPVEQLDAAHLAEIPQAATPAQIQNLRSKWETESARLKQAAYYIAASGARENLVHPILPFVTDIVSNYGDYLASRADLLHDALTSEDFMLLSRIYYESADVDGKSHFRNLLLPVLQNNQNGLDAMEIVKAVDLDATAHSALSTFLHRYDKLKASGFVFPQFQFIDPNTREVEPSESTTKAVFHFFENEKPGIAQESALRVRQYLGELITPDPNSPSNRSDLDEFLEVAGQDSAHTTDAYGILQTLSTYSNRDTHTITDFLQLVCRTLAPGTACALQPTKP